MNTNNLWLNRIEYSNYSNNYTVYKIIHNNDQLMNWLRFIYTVRISYSSKIPREDANLYSRLTTFMADISAISSLDTKLHRPNTNTLNTIVQ